MKGCHACEVAAEIAAGKYAGMDWDRIPCSTCDVTGGFEQSFEYYENLMEPDALSGVASAKEAEDERDSEMAGEEKLPLSVMRSLVLGLLRLEPEIRDVVAWRFAGAKYKDIALAQGVTPQCVEKRLQIAMRQWPAVRALFPRKLVRLRSGKKKRRSLKVRRPHNPLRKVR